MAACVTASSIAAELYMVTPLLHSTGCVLSYTMAGAKTRCKGCVMHYCFVTLFVNYRQGLGRHGNEYGPLQEIPDWSYAG